MNYVGLMSRLRSIIAEELVDPHLFPDLSLRSILFVGHGINEADGLMDCVTTLGFEWFLECYDEMRNSLSVPAVPPCPIVVNSAEKCVPFFAGTARCESEPQSAEL